MNAITTINRPHDRGVHVDLSGVGSAVLRDCSAHDTALTALWLHCGEIAMCFGRLTRDDLVDLGRLCEARLAQLGAPAGAGQ